MKDAGMAERPSTIERAYQLAREGAGLIEIRRVLQMEGYGDAKQHLASLRFSADLRRLAKLAADDVRG